MTKSNDENCSWEKNFFHAYEKDNKIEVLNKNLKKFMADCQWFPVISEKDVEYFDFVKYLMS